MELLTFWLPAAALTLIVAALIVLGFMRGAAVRQNVDTSDMPRRDVRIYADQLREIERDQARGLLDPAEAQRLHAEIARRLVDADREKRPEAALAPPLMRRLAPVLVLLAVITAGGLYWREGAPLYPDLPLTQRLVDAAEMRATRPDQTTLEAAWLARSDRPTEPEVEEEFQALMIQLRATLDTRPDDLQGHQLLARNEANLGNHAAAARAQARVVSLQGAEAPIGDRVFLAESLILAAGGIVSPEAEAVVEDILRRDPRNGPGRYYTGLMFAQTGRPDLTFRLWRSLLEDSQPEAPWVPHIRSTLEDLAAIAGVRYTLPPMAAQGARGPSEADMAAAADLTEQERESMIGGMVEGLAARLGTQGGPAGDWARLISALGVLEQTERARAIWAEARMVFADQPDQLRIISDAARALGFED